MSSTARDLFLILGGMAMGLGLHEVAHLTWDGYREWRKGRGQWFRPQSRSKAPPGPAPAQHPTPRPIKGQRPAEGRHRPKQREVRFGGRVRRRIVKQPARVAAGPALPVEESAGQADGD